VPLTLLAYLAAASQAMISSYQKGLVAVQAASASSLVPRLPPATWAAYNASLTKTGTAVAAVPKTATVNSGQLMGYLNTALSLYQYDSVFTLGQATVFPGAAQCNALAADASGALPTGQACPAPQLLAAGVAPTWPPA
jgi:hypothetical protein